jgi:hypothetical protein
MKAPVPMVCPKCGRAIPAGTLIARIGSSGATPRYAHAACVKPAAPKATPSLPPDPRRPAGPKGWVTEDQFALPGDALARLHGQTDAPDERADVVGPRDSDARVENPDTTTEAGDEPAGTQGDDAASGEAADPTADGRSGKKRAPERGRGDPAEGDGDDAGTGEGDEDGDGEESDDDTDTDGDGDGAGKEEGDGKEGGDEGDEDGAGGGDEEGDEAGDEPADGEGDPADDGKEVDKPEPKKGEEKAGKQKPDQPSGKPKPPARPKEKTGKLEDLPDDLLLKLAMLAAQMAHERLRSTIEPKLARLIAESAEPLTAKMAAEFQARMGDSVREQLKRAVSDTRKFAEQTISDLRREVDRRVEEEVKRLDAMRPVVHKVKRADGGEHTFGDGELFHFAFDETLKLCGAGFDVFTPGPTGCGKTHMFQQIAVALGLPFGIVSGTGGVTEVELFGNSTPNITTGEQVYQPTPFVTLYEGGGLFLLDEADGMDANCLLKVNAAIANGYCAIPKRLGVPMAKRHPNFVFALAANTWGGGATRQYCGRNKLDEATLDRFRAGTVPMDYDPNLEMRLVGDQELYRTLSGWRKRITENNLPRVLSTRFMVHAVRLKAMGYTTAEIGRKLTGGWTAGEVAKVTAA